MDTIAHAAPGSAACVIFQGSESNAGRQKKRGWLLPDASKSSGRRHPRQGARSAAKGASHSFGLMATWRGSTQCFTSAL
jgi:hypothetical protein